MTLRPLLLASLLLAACDGAQPTGHDDDALRGPIGKADLFGSCAANDDCGFQVTDGNCWCDDFCAAFGDCCADYAEVCETELASCGGHTIGPAPTCDDGEYCHYEPTDTCGWADAAGVCMTVPNGCTKILLRVCGCDGTTYDNECMAHAAGTSVLNEGACQDTGPEPGFCGGFLGIGCPDDQYCAYSEEAMCGAADQGGTCVDRPEACIQLYDPVCGCDGQTYGNACTAASAGVSVVHDGECEDTSIFCGGFGNLPCPADLECVDDPNDDCDVSDGGADCGGICI